jgi:hypothetical protein
MSFLTRHFRRIVPSFCAEFVASLDQGRLAAAFQGYVEKFAKNVPVKGRRIPILSRCYYYKDFDEKEA